MADLSKLAAKAEGECLPTRAHVAMVSIRYDKNSEEVQKLIPESGYVFKTLYNSPVKAQAADGKEWFGDVESLGIATKDDTEYRILVVGDMDECQVVTVSYSSDKKTVYLRKEERINSGRMTMSRCPERQRTVLAVPAAVKWFCDIKEGRMCNVSQGD